MKSDWFMSTDPNLKALALQEPRDQNREVHNEF